MAYEKRNACLLALLKPGRSASAQLTVGKEEGEWGRTGDTVRVPAVCGRQYLPDIDNCQIDACEVPFSVRLIYWDICTYMYVVLGTRREMISKVTGASE